MNFPEVNHNVIIPHGFHQTNPENGSAVRHKDTTMAKNVSTEWVVNAEPEAAYQQGPYLWNSGPQNYLCF